MTKVEKIKARPIIFNSEMVSAILSDRKTQTRRAIKPQPYTERADASIGFEDENLVEFHWDKSEKASMFVANPYDMLSFCPYGVPRDKLWVRETFAIESNFNMDSSKAYPPPFNDGRPTRWIEDEEFGDHWEQCHYRATDPNPELVYEDYGEEGPAVRWKPSTNMPRWASRIMLEVVGVRVERLHEITVRDVIAEGIVKLEEAHIETYPLDLIVNRSEHYTPWSKFWDSINGKKYPFSSNPWVWVVEFEACNE